MSGAPTDTTSDGSLHGTTIILGVTGGIAAYKAAYLARLLVRDGAEVHAVLSAGAEQLVGAATFAGITGQPARTRVWDDPEDIVHVRLARVADAVVVAPATAHLLAKAAAGLADDLLTNILLMARCPVVLAPAMHTEMWEHDATQSNAAILRDRGLELVGPASGELAGGDVGEGRMVEPEAILDAVRRVLGRTRQLVGLRVVVTAGPTREAIDPVRFITNRSSGRMGFALAAEAAVRGAEVDLVAGPVHLDTPAGVRRHDVTTASDMYDVTTKLASDADVVVKAAAVTDFRPTGAADQKLKKGEGAPTIELTMNPDILAELGERRQGDRPVLVGFAAETTDPEGYGKRKLEEKKVDLVVVNDVSADDAGFEVETNRVVILRDGGRVDVPLSTKQDVARAVWDEIMSLLGD
jgi:phosphopantothenoylcysteine decarboxylase / phosphopantothenate---cysteine ligase